MLGESIDSATLGSCSDNNEVNISDTQGLAVIGNVDVHCHYDSSFDQDIFLYSDLHKRPVIVIPEDSGCHFGGGKFLVIGPGPVFLFSKGVKETYTEGSSIIV